MLSFPMRGYSVALDFPNNTKVRHLQNELNRKIADMEGRIYLAKDALLTECLFEKMYVNELPNWRRIIKKIDPDNKFNSLMSTRLNMRGGVNGE
jgi:decaprenylphospho-beta-D-ribofuranose 2-oxidase